MAKSPAISRRTVVGGLASTALACSTGRPRMMPAHAGAGEDAAGAAGAGGAPSMGGRGGSGGSAADAASGGAPGADATRAADANVQAPADAAGDRAAADANAAAVPSGTIIDVHVHFLYGGAVPPPDFDKMVRPLGVSGTVVVEAGTNNDAILALAEANPIIVGFSGHLDLGSVGFKDQLKKYAANKFFRGIRSYGWDKPANMSDLAALADLDMELDCLTDPNGLLGVADAAKRVPSLRFVINHVGQPKYAGGTPPADFISKMETVAKQPNVWLKISSLRTLGGTTVEFWKPMFDELWRIFGPDRLLYASNYPVSNDYAAELSITKQYLADKPRDVVDKFYARNAVAAYKWLRR